MRKIKELTTEQKKKVVVMSKELLTKAWEVRGSVLVLPSKFLCNNIWYIILPKLKRKTVNHIQDCLGILFPELMLLKEKWMVEWRWVTSGFVIVGMTPNEAVARFSKLVYLVKSRHKTLHSRIVQRPNGESDIRLG